MLKIKNLCVAIEGKEILQGLNLVVKPGEVHAIMGPNGSGKSTLAYAIAGHPRYELQMLNAKCQISLDGKSLIGKTPDERARQGLFLAFQYPVAVEGVTVEQLLRKVAGKGLSALEFRRYLEKEAEKLGIKTELLRRSLNDGFSGGEKKRVEILQLAVMKPRYAVLDETDSGLDIDALRVIANGIWRMANSKTGIILITHYQRILKFVQPDWVHVMIKGKIVKSGGKELAAELERKGYGTLRAN
ncbi:MAG: Fe-S cluster assembly ATPase SufC [Candidatus Chisholmbacteria bacterium RIFCSPHIGHO2_01_FULL_48_12]|uniref:Fe-S cluster assembly ATPase SufC n=1 Tax=Candidatus Chisholmbacteria bacterium RIFCSPHIGHO2_01_FULL_48_12 TaxID=1797589 RepID=A0A1G1VRR3_9BACT|nr:MAG: Fe-S cluster assembly ATPase SufC [Candidatus Chisholmbacteria bacterium RIFCSPHIGHO2_01_FULL_48_12]